MTKRRETPGDTRDDRSEEEIRQRHIELAREQIRTFAKAFDDEQERQREGRPIEPITPPRVGGEPQHGPGFLRGRPQVKVTGLTKNAERAARSFAAAPKTARERAAEEDLPSSTSWGLPRTANRQLTRVANVLLIRARASRNAATFSADLAWFVDEWRDVMKTHRVEITTATAEGTAARIEELFGAGFADDFWTALFGVRARLDRMRARAKARGAPQPVASGAPHAVG